MYVSVSLSGYVQKPEEGSKSPEAAVAIGCEPADITLGKQCSENGHNKLRKPTGTKNNSNDSPFCSNEVKVIY